MFELYNLVAELKLGAGSSSDKSVESEVDCLVEGVVSFIMISCCRGDGEHGDSPTFSQSLLDLMKVWSFERCAKDAGNKDFLNVLFPVINDEVRVGLVEGREVGYLAGIVMYEAFLMRLLLRVGSEEPKLSGQDLQSLAADTIAGLKCCYFFDVLFEMLLEPIKPLIWFLIPSDDLLLRKVLFDAIIFVELPFLNPESRKQHRSNHLKSLALTWVLVVEKAVLFMRQENNDFKANTYARAFSEFLAHSGLVGWLTNNHGIEDLMNKPVFSTPTAFIDWLSNLQKLCLQNCIPDTLKLIEKAVGCRSSMNRLVAMQESIPTSNNTFLTSKSNDVEMVRCLDASNAGLEHNFCDQITEGRRKRKEGGIEEDWWAAPSKLLKSHQSDGFGFVRSCDFHEVKKDRTTEVRGSSLQSQEEDMDVMVQ